MAKEVVVTHEGYNKAGRRTGHPENCKRSEIAEKIKVARGYGNLSENANTMPPRKSRLWLKPALLTWKLP